MDIREISQAEEVQAETDDQVGLPDPHALGKISREEEDVPDDQDMIVEGERREVRR